MKKLLKVLCLMSVLGICISAQTGNDDYHKNEFFVGYSNQLTDDFRRESASGVEVSYVHNMSRFFGIKGDFSAAYKKTTRTFAFNDPVAGISSVDFERQTQLYNFLGGVQVKDNASTARFKPFAHILGGVAVNRDSNKNFRCTSGNCVPINFTRTKFTDTNFSAALGGGLDIRINKRVDFRLIQVDYNPIFADGRRQDNVRFGIGFVFK